MTLKKKLIWLSLLFFFIPLGRAQINQFQPITTTAIERLMQSVVSVQTRTDGDATSLRTLGQQRQGSGVVIGEDLVLTIGYLLIEAQTVDLTDRNGRKIPGQVKAVDNISGFGLIRSLVPLRLLPIYMGDSDALKVPTKVLTLGQGEQRPTELELVSRQPFAGNWEYLLEAPLMTLPAVNNWSGAGLFDANGQLIGVGSLLVPDVFGDKKPALGNLFVPINEIKSHLPELLTLGKRSGLARSWLGVNSQAIPGGGLMVQRVTPGSPAALAGIRAEDILVAIQGQVILDLRDFYLRLWAVGPAGSSLELTFKRNGNEQKVKVITGDRSQNLRSPRGI